MFDREGSVHEVINVDSPFDSDGILIPFDGFHIVLSQPQVKKYQPLVIDFPFLCVVSKWVLPVFG